MQETTGQGFHTITADQASQQLGVDTNGLSDTEAGSRLKRFGPNKLPRGRRAGIFRILLRQFRDPLIYILLLAAVVSLALGNWSDAVFILIVLAVNAAIGAAQEWKAESSAGDLEKTMTNNAWVRRDGRRREIDRTDVVPGDIVLLEPGGSVPADLRLLSTKRLRIDESLLTGESEAARKNEDAELPENTPLADRENLAHAGTTVVDGRGEGVAVRTGRQTEIGRIAESLTEEAEPPPLVIKLNRFTRHISIFVLVAIVVLAVGQLARGTPFVEIFFLTVALAVAAIPEALPVGITVALSISTKRMADRNVIVRRLPAVEGLGACTLIATDKTGTLTANKLTVKKLLLPESRELEIGGTGLELEGRLHRSQEEAGQADRQRAEALSFTGVLCNEAELHSESDDVETVGDSVDVAFLVLAAKLNQLRRASSDEYPEFGLIPFEPEHRFAASFRRHNGDTVAHVKGAAEVVVPMCSDVDQNQLLARADELAGQGYRVLALAASPVEAAVVEKDGRQALQRLTFLGLAALIDPVREAVPDAVKQCQRAGVDVRMVTGDHPSTGLAIGRQVGLADDGDTALTGRDLVELGSGSDQRKQSILDSPVFARVEPAQKTAIVNTLQDDGHFVAVTGDGVNDAPALRAAHIGVAMGRSGTDIARRAADLILTDDNFASIVAGIEQGRVAYDNVRKVTWQLVATGAAEIVLFFLALVTGTPLPLTAIQLLWLNVVTNGVQNLALGAEPAEPGIMDRPPRPPDQPLFNRRLIEETLLTGFWSGLAGFGAFYWLLACGWPEAQARNVLLLLMVLFENLNILNCRSETRSIFRIPFWSNPLLLVTIAAAHLVHIAAMYVPWLRDVLHVQPVNGQTWLLSLALACSLIAVFEIYKLLRAGK